MTPRKSFSPYNLGNFFLNVTRYRSGFDSSVPRIWVDISIPTIIPKHKYGFHVNQGLRSLYTDDHDQLICHSDHSIRTSGKEIANDVKKPIAPSQLEPNSPSWRKWILGAILTLVLPFWKAKWEKLLKVEGEMEKVIEVVEIVAETVEKVASETENLSKKLADEIPGDGKIKKATLFVERVSERVEKEARLTEDIIHKVDELKHEVEELF